MISEASKNAHETSGENEEESVEEHFSSKVDKGTSAITDDDRIEDNDAAKELSVVEEENKSNASIPEQDNVDANNEDAKNEKKSRSERYREEEIVGIFQTVTNYAG